MSEMLSKELYKKKKVVSKKIVDEQKTKQKN